LPGLHNFSSFAYIFLSQTIEMPASLIFLPILLLSLSGALNASFIAPRQAVAHATPTVKEHGILAIVPTATGQIGINPVISDLGDPDTYIGEIYGTDTQYITLDPPDFTTKVFLVARRF
jgi:hypothetical protein